MREHIGICHSLPAFFTELNVLQLPPFLIFSHFVYIYIYIFLIYLTMVILVDFNLSYREQFYKYLAQVSY